MSAMYSPSLANLSFPIPSSYIWNMRVAPPGPTTSAIRLAVVSMCGAPSAVDMARITHSKPAGAGAISGGPSVIGFKTSLTNKTDPLPPNDSMPHCPGSGSSTVNTFIPDADKTSTVVDPAVSR